MDDDPNSAPKAPAPTVILLLRVFPEGTPFDVVLFSWQGFELVVPGRYAKTLSMEVPSSLVGRFGDYAVHVRVPGPPATIELFGWSSALRDDPHTTPDERLMPLGAVVGNKAQFIGKFVTGWLPDPPAMATKAIT